MYSSSLARHKIMQLERLPALSITVGKLLAMLSNDDVEIDDLATVIEQDPGLTARVIGLANAAYFARSNPVITVNEAIIRVLGLQMVKTLAFSIALCGAFDTSRCPGFRLDRYWYLAFGGAQLSRLLVAQTATEARADPDEIYLSALLYDIGVLVLVHEFPHDYAGVLDKMAKEPHQDTASLERSLMGITSREAGEWLTHRWHLPPFVVQTIATQDTPEEFADLPLRSKIIRSVIQWLNRESEESLMDLVELQRF